MNVTVAYGRQRVEVEAPAGSGVENPPTAALANPVAALQAALERPRDYPPLRQAIIPDDQVTVLVDERLPQVGLLLTALLDHILEAKVAPEAITLLCPSAAGGQPWLTALPDYLEEVRCEIHDPKERKRLSYVATSQKGKPLYLNRNAIDASQLVVLTGRRFDPLLGYGGGEGAIYPALSDEATRLASLPDWSLKAPGATPWPARAEATEVVWLIGAPFFVQVIAGAGDSIADIVAGPASACAEGVRRLDARWRRKVAHAAQTVVATVSGDPAHHGFADLADALLAAWRVLEPGGRIVLLTEANPSEWPGFDLLRGAEDPELALKELRQHRHFDHQAAWQWASVAQQAQLFLLSGLSDETTEELFAVPLHNLREVQRLLSGSTSCLFLGDAHKMMATLD